MKQIECAVCHKVLTPGEPPAGWVATLFEGTVTYECSQCEYADEPTEAMIETRGFGDSRLMELAGLTVNDERYRPGKVEVDVSRFGQLPHLRSTNSKL